MLRCVRRDFDETEKRGVYYRPKKAQDIFNSFPSVARNHCSPYASVGVVKVGSDQHYKAPSNRFVEVTKKSIFNILHPIYEMVIH
jgi:hypothetical protein